MAWFYRIFKWGLAGCWCIAAWMFYAAGIEADLVSLWAACMVCGLLEREAVRHG